MRVAGSVCLVALLISFGASICGALLASPTKGEAFEGRPLADVLEELRQDGLALNFSSALVPPDYVVPREPPAGETLDRLRGVLADAGLELRPAPGGRSWLVVAARRDRVLRGRVFSTGRKRPIGGARVSLIAAHVQDGRTLETRSRPDGTFRFDGLDGRLYVLQIEAIGFTSREHAPVTAASAGFPLAISLVPLPRFAAEITVTPGEHSLVSSAGDGAFRLDREQVGVVPSYGGDLTRVLGSVPGITAPDNSAALSIRGSEAADVAFVLDGLELYEPFHLADFQSPFSFIDSNRVESVDVLAGGFPAEFGDRHGGFIAVDTLQPLETAETQIRVGTLNSAVSHAAPLSRGSLSVSARRWYPDAVRESTELGDDELNPEFSDAYLRYTTHLSPETYLSAHLLFAQDTVDAVEPDGNEEVRADNESVYAWVRSWTRWSDKLFSETVFSAGQLRRLREGISEPEDDPIRVRDQRRVYFCGLRHDVRRQNSPRNLTKGGVEVRPLDARYSYASELPGARQQIALEPDGTSFSAYLSHRASVSPSLALELGMRWDDQNFAGAAQWSPRLNGVWRKGSQELRFAFGHYFQSQRIYELPLEDGQTSFFAPERSVQVDLSYRRGWSNGLQFRADAYRRRITDVQPRFENVFNPLELFPETESDRNLIAPESARTEGVELSLQAPSDRSWTWWLSYAWSRSRDRIAGHDVPRSQDQPHTLKLALARQRGPWSVALTGTAHSGWPTVPAEVVQLAGGPELRLGPRNSIRHPTYVRVDGKLAYALTVRNTALSFELEVLNLADRQNVCCVDEIELGFDGSGNPFLIRDVDTWLGITPSFSLRISF
ncbi:hypothetical protein ABI59_16005 [Acidobacteria bacterium Mor1]|nr:hypothetical protein ABI59_16005 [Acidobacteria bacterium Mor1]